VPGIGEEHQRKQPAHLAVAGEQGVHRAGQADGFTRQLGAVEIGPGAARVTLVEDEVEDVEHRAESLRAFLAVGHLEGHAGSLDALLRPADPLGHRRLGHEERTGDLRGGQTADGPQRQRDRGGFGERGVATHEQGDERVVVVSAVGGRDRRRISELLASSARLLAAEVIGLLAQRGLDQPRARVLG
jgi:hypothetical protein